MLQEKKKYYKQLIREAKTGSAIKKMSEEIPELDFQNQLTVIASTHTRLEQEQTSGLLSSEEYNARLNRINQSLITLIDTLGEHIGHGTTGAHERNSGVQTINYLPILLIVVAGIYIVSRLEKSEPSTDLTSEQVLDSVAEKTLPATDKVSANSVAPKEKVTSTAEVLEKVGSQTKNAQEQGYTEETALDQADLGYPFSNYDGQVFKSRYLFWTENINTTDEGREYKIGSSQQYGLLYTQAEAGRACARVGGRLPSTTDWEELLTHYKYRIGTAPNIERIGLKLGGRIDVDGKSYEIDRSGYYWTDTEITGELSKYVFFSNSTPYVDFNSGFSSLRLSCKCVINK